VPSSLIASWEATGPPGRFWVAPPTVVTSRNALKFCTTPRAISSEASRTDSGSSTNTTPRVRSTQKFPIVVARRRVRPRMSATATARPTPAETKFCTARPAIWVRWLMVCSPR